jgi:heme-binding NEAT domain protein
VGRFHFQLSVRQLANTSNSNAQQQQQKTAQSSTSSNTNTSSSQSESDPYTLLMNASTTLTSCPIHSRHISVRKRRVSLGNEINAQQQQEQFELDMSDEDDEEEEEIENNVKTHPSLINFSPLSSPITTCDGGFILHQSPQPIVIEARANNIE